MAWAVTKDAPESTSADGLMPQKPSLGAPHILHISTEEVVSPGGSYVKKQQEPEVHTAEGANLEADML